VAAQVAATAQAAQAAQAVQAAAQAAVAAEAARVQQEEQALRLQQEQAKAAEDARVAAQAQAAADAQAVADAQMQPADEEKTSAQWLEEMRAHPEDACIQAKGCRHLADELYDMDWEDRKPVVELVLKALRTHPTDASVNISGLSFLRWNFLEIDESEQIDAGELQALEFMAGYTGYSQEMCDWMEQCQMTGVIAIALELDPRSARKNLLCHVIRQLATSSEFFTGGGENFDRPAAHSSRDETILPGLLQLCSLSSDAHKEAVDTFSTLIWEPRTQDALTQWALEEERLGNVEDYIQDIEELVAEYPENASTALSGNNILEFLYDVHHQDDPDDDDDDENGQLVAAAPDEAVDGLATQFTASSIQQAVAAGAAAAAAEQQEVPGALHDPLSRSLVPAQPRGKRKADDDDNVSMHSSKYSRSSSGAKVEQDLSGMEGDIQAGERAIAELDAEEQSESKQDTEMAESKQEEEDEQMAETHVPAPTPPPISFGDFPISASSSESSSDSSDDE
jgi:hypothetical protein